MKRAVAIFAKAPVPGRVKTRLTPPLSPEESAALYRCMLLDTVTRVRSLRTDTFIFYDGDTAFFRQACPGLPLIPQNGECLGKRLEHAFTTLDSKGYRATVVIGTDAPDLPVGFISQAFDEMESGKDVVFGPAEDGGYYLVALNSPCADLFRGISWSTPQVLEQSLEKAKNAGLAPALLPTWYDVDCIDDLYRPGLSDAHSGAPLTRHFISGLDLAILRAADAV